MSTRPVQEMSDTSAAIRAAKEVQADSLAPELYRLSGEWFTKAKREYRFKNFHLAREYSDIARRYAEKAEFEAMRNGGNRTDPALADPMANEGTKPPSEGGAPGGSPPSEPPPPGP